MRSDSFMGICFMALGMFLFSAVDTMAKFLSDGMHPIQIVWFRQLGLLCGVVVFLLLRGPAFLVSKQPLLQVMRGATAAGSACLFVMALRYVPLADAAAVSFVAPFIVIVLGVSVFGGGRCVFLRLPAGAIAVFKPCGSSIHDSGLYGDYQHEFDHVDVALRMADAGFFARWAVIGGDEHSGRFG